MPSLIDNPIAYAQFQLRGGWKNTLGVTGVAALVLVGLILLTVRMAEPRTGPAWNGWVVGILTIEAAILLLYGSSRVSAAIRRDITQRMLESHQLMPVGGMTAVAGYIVGAASQAMVLAGAAALIGMGVAQKAGIDVTHFLFANVALLLYALFIWVVSAFAAFLMKGGFGIIIGAMLGILMSGGMLISLLPPLRVLAGTAFIEGIFSMKTNASFIPWAYGISVLSQAFVGVICYIGAARKYRRGEDSAFGPSLGLAMVAGWVAIGAIAIVWQREFWPEFFYRQPDAVDQMLAALISTMILAIVPLASAAWAHVEWRRHRLEEDPRQMRRPLPIWAVAIAVGLLATPLAWSMNAADAEARRSAQTVVVSGSVTTTIAADAVETRPAPTAQQIIGTALVVVSFGVGMGYLLRWVYLAAPGALLIGGLWLLVTWLGPLFVDFVIHTAKAADNYERLPPVVGAFSPIGALLQIWGDDGYDYRLGLIGQMVINAIPILMNLGKMRGTLAKAA